MRMKKSTFKVIKSRQSGGGGGGGAGRRIGRCIGDQPGHVWGGVFIPLCTRGIVAKAHCGKTTTLLCRKLDRGWRSITRVRTEMAELMAMIPR